MAEAAANGTIELAKADVGSVTMCGCGVVSVHVGGVSLRMEAAAFAEVELMLRSAMETMCAMAQARRQPAKHAAVSRMTH